MIKHLNPQRNAVYNPFHSMTHRSFKLFLSYSYVRYTIYIYLQFLPRQWRREGNLKKREGNLKKREEERRREKREEERRREENLKRRESEEKRI